MMNIEYIRKHGFKSRTPLHNFNGEFVQWLKTPDLLSVIVRRIYCVGKPGRADTTGTYGRPSFI